MSEKELRIACPCCQSQLSIDLPSGKVVGWLRAGDKDEPANAAPGERWEAAADRVKGRSEGGEDRFKRAVEREQTRGNDLDELFRRQQGKLKDAPEGQVKPPTQGE